MTYPVNEQEFIDKWLEALGKPEEGDAELAVAIANKINRGYYAGKEDEIRIGVQLKEAVAKSQQEEVTECRE